MLILKDRKKPVDFSTIGKNALIINSVIHLNKVTFVKNCIFYNCDLFDVEESNHRLKGVSHFQNCKFINCSSTGNPYSFNRDCFVIGCTINNYVYIHSVPCLFINNTINSDVNLLISMDTETTGDGIYNPIIRNNDFSKKSLVSSISHESSLLFDILEFNKNLKNIFISNSIIEGYSRKPHRKVDFLDKEIPFDLVFAESFIFKHLDLRGIKMSQRIIFGNSVVFNDCLMEGADLSSLGGFGNLKNIFFHNCDERENIIIPKNVEIGRTS